MSVETASRDGRYDVVHRPPAAGGTLRGVVAGAGALLCLAPLLLLPAASDAALPGLAAAEAVLLATALKLLAERSRARRIHVSLHVATGEVEVRTGVRPFAAVRAFGVVEVDRFLLSREGTEEPGAFDLFLVPVTGGPVRVLSGETDEKLAKDVGLILAEGVGVPLEDRRHPSAEPGRREPLPPPRVARMEGGGRTVFAWDYRDRFRPAAALAALGGAAAAATAAARVVPASPWLQVAGGALLVITALALLAHAAYALAARRLVLRPDAVRLERYLAGIPLGGRLVPYEALKAVLVLPRGPLAAVSLRAGTPGAGARLPLEDRRVAAWVRALLERAAHDAGRRGAPLAG